MTILVTGATGDVGHRVAAGLLDAGERVRVAARRPADVADLAARGAEPVHLDLRDASTVRPALDGVQRVFLLTPPAPDQADLERTAIDAAAEAGVERLVRVSAADSNLRTPVPWARAHALADHHLAGTDLDWTVLRADAFMQDLLPQAPAVRRGLLPHTSRAGQVSWIDTQDLADVARTTLLEPGHRRATYFLTGPEALSFPEVADRMSRHVGHRVRAVFLPGPAYRALLRVSGESGFMAGGLTSQFAHAIRSRLDVDTTWEVERLQGRPATTLDAWLQDNSGAFSRSG